MGIIFSIFALCPMQTGVAQCDDENASGINWDFDEAQSQTFSLGSYISETFTPQILSDSKRMREYISDERFNILRMQCGDMRAVDAIYLKALKIGEYNIARALFLSLVAVLDRRKVEVKLPIISSIELPLSLESDSIFTKRFKHLPSKVYSDTPNEGDKDKLQHFFASAYLTFVSEAPKLARSTGNLVEWGEAKIVVGGTDDPRDKRANKHGEKFGRDLIVVKTLLPSDYLIFRSEQRK
jgi:hypothetical protein